MINAADTQNSDWDIVIVGGGPAGTSTAITLADKGYRVMLLEKQNNVTFKLGESLPPASVGIVEHLLGAIDTPVTEAAPDSLPCYATKTAGNISVWEDNTEKISDFFFTPAGFGLCLNRANFDKALRHKATSVGVTVRNGVQFKHCQVKHKTQPTPGIQDHLSTPPYWNIEVRTATHTEQHTSRYLIDCSGRQAVVTTALGITRSFHDTLFAYAQRYTTRCPYDDDRYTRLEAGPHGWWYSNPLRQVDYDTEDAASPITGHERLVVFHTDKNHPAAQQASHSAGFSMLLDASQHIKQLLEHYEYTPTGKIRGASAASERLTHFAGNGWMAVGDAAQAYDPLSSQGVYKALSTGIEAGQLIHYALQEATKNTHTEHIGLTNGYIARYVREQERLWTQYTEQYQLYYHSQQRWSDEPFWMSRHTSTERHYDTHSTQSRHQFAKETL